MTGRWRIALLMVAISILGACGRKEAPKPRVISAKSMAEPAKAAAETSAPVDEAAAAPAPQGEPTRTGQKSAKALAEPERRGSAIGQVLGAPADYLYAATVTSRRYADKKTALIQVKRDIELFKAQMDRHPKDLQELEEYRGTELPKLREVERYEYDAKTGEVSIVDR